MLGFDIEWTVTYRVGEPPLPTALLQLATAKECFLLHLAQFNSSNNEEQPGASGGVCLPEALREILEGVLGVLFFVEFQWNFSCELLLFTVGVRGVFGSR